MWLWMEMSLQLTCEELGHERVIHQEKGWGTFLGTLSANRGQHILAKVSAAQWPELLQCRCLGA